MNNTQRNFGRRTACACAHLLCVALLTPLFASAYDVESVPPRDAKNFLVSPAKVELTLDPGESRVVDIVLENQTGSAQHFSVSAEDIKGSDNPEEAVVLLGDDRGPYSLRDYIEVSEPEFDLSHSSRTRIPVTVSVPFDAAPGGYFGTVLFATAGKSEESGAALVSRIGTLFFVTVPGATHEEGSLESFAVASTDNDEPLVFQVVFRNSGNVYLNPSGYITITNMFGRAVETIELDPWYVLPDSVRLREVLLDRKNLFGRYNAILSLNPGFRGEITNETISFFVLPRGGTAFFGYLAGLLVFLAIAVVVIRLRMSKRSLS